MSRAVKRSRIFIILFFLLGLGVVIRHAQLVTSEPENLWGNESLQADCGVVLTGGPGRIREGFELLAEKKIQKLVVSGVNKDSRMIEIFPYSSYYPEVNFENIFFREKVRNDLWECSS